MRLNRLQSAAVAQSVERVLGKDEVMGPSPISSSCVGPCSIVSTNYQLTRLIRTQGE